MCVQKETMQQTAVEAASQRHHPGATRGSSWAAPFADFLVMPLPAGSFYGYRIRPREGREHLELLMEEVLPF